MAGKADPLHEHESVRDVVGRLLAAVESLPARSSEPGEQPLGAPQPAGPAVFLFSSLREGQGTSTIAAAVARALAETGRRTVLVVPTPANGEPAPAGSIPLRDVLEGARPIAFEQPPLLTLEVPSRYAEFPDASRNPHTWLKGSEVVIIDAPGLADGLTRYWVPGVEGVVLVLDGERVSVRAVVEAREEIARIGGRFVGVVLNRFRSRIPRFLEPYLNYG